MQSWVRTSISGALVAGLIVVGSGSKLWVRLTEGGSRPPTALSRPAPRTPLVVGYYGEQNLDASMPFMTTRQRLSWIITTNYSFTDASGRLQGTHNPTILNAAHRNGIKVHFRVANFARGDFSREVAHAILTQPAPRTRAIGGILHTLDAFGYDGVNIDFENIAPRDRRALTAFMARLSWAVRSRGKTLSIAVPPTTHDQPDNDWSGAFDLRALGRVTDAVIVMAYDEHWRTSGPGPIAALPWVEAVVQHAAREVGPDKLLLGVAFYGYDWPRRGFATGITMREAVSKASYTKAPILWDSQDQVPYYKTAGRTVYFENAYSIEQKLTLATRQKLAGVAAWRIGHELPEVWDVFAMYQTSPYELTSRKLTRQAPTASKSTSLMPEVMRTPLAGK